MATVKPDPTTRSIGDPDLEASWPVWDGGGAEHLEGYDDLASYVVPDALRDLQLVGDLPDEDLKERARRLYDRLKAKDIEYGHEPWTPYGVQQIRDAGWMLRDRWGTCIDLTVTLAAMVLEAGMRPWIAVQQGHAFLAVDIERELADQPAAAPLDTMSAQARVAEGRLVAIECTHATRQGGDFAEAVRLGRQCLATETYFVDVAGIQRGDELRPEIRVRSQHRPRTQRPGLLLYLKGSEQRFIEYGAQRALFEQLLTASGTYVLLGPSGVGKSSLARELVAREQLGRGWFLNASEPKTLAVSLSDAERAELNRDVVGTADVDKGGFTQGALERLRAMHERWVVVLDNADGDPGALSSLLPRPRADQLVVVTSTNPDWAAAPGVTVVPLPAVDSSEVAAELKGPELVGLVAGRPLLLRAFRSLMDATGLSGAQIAAEEPVAGTVDPELAGPLALWRTAHGTSLTREIDIRLCLEMAYLPPGQQRTPVLVQRHPGGADALELIERCGLITRSRDGFLRMHRLIGAAIRSDVGASRPDFDDEVVVDVAGDPSLREDLDRYGDLATIQRLDQRLATVDSRTGAADSLLGIALHGVAWLLELHGQTAPSERAYGRAERHLESRPDLRADVLHSKARTVNQQHARDEDRLRQAVRWAREAEELLTADGGHAATAARCVAMRGLLMQKLAGFPQAGETTLGLLREALQVIEDAHKLRVEALKEDPQNPELARSEFNLAGIRINLAKVEPGRTREHLDRAAEVYENVRRRRRDEIYQREIHPHIAACIIGLAYVDYYRALLLPASQTQRTEWLRDATRNAANALEQRQELDGDIDQAESRKAARFLAKVALMRHLPPAGPTAPLNALTVEIAGEAAYAAVPRLPSAPALAEEAIATWVRSTALGAVVRAFDGTPPATPQPVDEALADLESFSERWDFRKGVERNLVGTPDLSAEVVQVVSHAALALGLVGTSVPASERYDHVLILGGLVRACLARPRHAAKLLAEKAINARSVTALGGFRPLRGDELELSDRFGLADLDDEFEAMDAGVRQAFGLDERAAVHRGEPSDVVGASWAVREYERSDGPAVRVVAAPSSKPGERRANTADTYEWFAEHFDDVRRGQRVLVITTDIYVPFQHADALRMLALPHGLEVDAVGVRPGDVDEQLAQAFASHNYLQEMRSTIRAFRALHTALKAHGGR